MTSKVQFLQLQQCLSSKSNEHNPSHVQRHTLPSQLLITQFRLNTHNLSRVLQNQKQTQIFHATNKTLFTKTHFDSRHLTSSSSFYFSQPSEGNCTLSEETTQRKHTYVIPSSSLNNKLSLATNKSTSPAKIILQKRRLNRSYETVLFLSAKRISVSPQLLTLFLCDSKFRFSTRLDVNHITV